MWARFDGIPATWRKRAWHAFGLGAAVVFVAVVVAAMAGACAFAAESSAGALASSSASRSSAAAESRASSASSENDASGYAVSADPFEDALPVRIPDGVYQIDVVLTGGSGKANVSSPAEFEVFGGRAVVRLVWSSPYYDYMIVAGKKYLPVNDGGNSEFVVPVTAYDEPVAVIGDTTAMSEAHEVSYELTVSSDSVAPLGDAVLAGSAHADASSGAAFSWPWAFFAVCAVLSTACIILSAVAVYRYQRR